MLNDVYNRRIIELAGTIPRIGRLADPDATATAHSRLCGSTVTVDLKMDGDKVDRLRPRSEGLRARPSLVVDHGEPRHRFKR